MQDVEWITSTDATERLGCSWKHLQKLARTGLLTHRKVPGSWSYFVAKEVDELVKKSITRASTTV